MVPNFAMVAGPSMQDVTAVVEDEDLDLTTVEEQIG